ncbi:MAG: hypothetical protein U5L05_15120 [Rubrivivax sp.]|nr:hypothetical protein [Rubrivivax sp.]
MAWQVLQAGFLPQPLGINRLVIPGNTEVNTRETSIEDRLRVTVTPAFPTRYRMTAKLGVSAAYIGNPGGSDWTTAPEPYADMSNSAKLRFDFPQGMSVRGPGGFDS